MNHTQKQLNNEAKLTAEERVAMKHELMSFMEANPPVPERKRSSIVSPYFPHLMRVPAFIAAFLVVMGGTAYAAENSLPNDFLYPIKTAVIEPLFFEAPARTPLAKAEASQKLVERRLEEAEALIDQNELDTETASVIVAAVDEHASDVQEFVAAASASGELSDALEVGSELESTLEAHTEVLESIAEDSAATEAVADIIEEVADQADEAEAVSETIEQQTSATVTEETDEYLNATAADAEAAIAALRSSLTAFVGQDEELITDATSYLTKSETAYTTGTDYLKLGQKSAALPHLRDALQFAQQGIILTESHDELDGEETGSNP